MSKKKEQYVGPPKIILLVCMVALIILSKIRLLTDNAVFGYLSAIPGLILMLAAFDMILNRKK